MYIQKRFNSDDNIQHLQITDNLKIILWQRLCLMQIHLIKHNFHIMTCLWDTVGFGEDQHSFAWGALQVVTFADMASSCSSLSLTIAVITSHHITSHHITSHHHQPPKSLLVYGNLLVLRHHTKTDFWHLWSLTDLIWDLCHLCTGKLCSWVRNHYQRNQDAFGFSFQGLPH